MNYSLLLKSTLILFLFALTAHAQKQPGETQSHDVTDHAVLAQGHYDAGRYTEAVEAFRLSISLRPDDALAYNGLGAALKRLDQNSEAIVAFQKAIELAPAMYQAYRNLGLVYSDLDLSDKAIEAYKKAISLNSNYAPAFTSLGGLYARLGRYREAQETLQRGIRLAPDDPILFYTLGWVYSHSKRYKEAAVAFRFAIKLDPEYAEARYNLSIVELRLGNRNGAIEQYSMLKASNKELADKIYDAIYGSSLLKVADK
jgi:tetratricopeptide (TPR) repeat protein